MSPISPEFNISLRDTAVGNKEPKTEYWLGKNVENGIENDLRVDAYLSGTICNAPNTMIPVKNCTRLMDSGLQENLHGINRPKDQGERRKRAKELANTRAPGTGETTAVDSDVPDDKQIGNAADSVPTPFLCGVLLTKGGEQTGEDHDKICDDRHGRVCTVNTSQKTKIKQQQRCSDCPVNVTSVVDLAAKQVVCAGKLAVMVFDFSAVEARGIPCGHGEIGDGSCDGNQCRDYVVQAPRDRDLPSHASEYG